MKTLKSTLSTQQHTKIRDKDQANDSLLRGVNKSKSQSMWAVGDDDDRNTEVSLDTNSLFKALNEILENSFRKDCTHISETSFEHMIEEMKEDIGGKKTEMAYLLLIQEKLTDLMDISRQKFKTFLEIFSVFLTSKIDKTRKKQKNNELNNFENIVSSNFKKKPQKKAYLKVQEARPAKASKQKGRREQSQSRKVSGSADKKLNRLFSKEKKQRKDSTRNVDKELINATAFAHEQSISFSTALATNLTVRNRKQKSPNEKKTKLKKVEQNTQKQGDEAFMFYRPKKSKK